MRLLNFDYPTQELEAALLNVGDEVVETVRLDTCRRPGLRRLPRLHLYLAPRTCPTRGSIFRSVLDEAMNRSAAQSELEVIATGLGYLRAPSPRKIEQNAVDPSPNC